MVVGSIVGSVITRARVHGAAALITEVDTRVAVGLGGE